MFKPQMKFQKILYLVLLILSALAFLYAIGLCTDLYPLYYSLAFGTVDGANFFKTIQPYNKALVTFSIVIVLASVIPFVFSSNKRRKYYLDNLISSIVQGGIYIAYSIYTIVNTIKYKAMYLDTVDLEAYAEFCKEKDYFYSGTTIWFDLGFVFAIIFIVATALIALNYVWKVKIVKKENELLEKGVNE